MAPPALSVVIKFLLKEHSQPMASYTKSVHSEQLLHKVSRLLASFVPFAHVLSPLQETCYPNASQDSPSIYKEPLRSPRIEQPISSISQSGTPVHTMQLVVRLSHYDKQTLDEQISSQNTRKV